MTLYTMGYGRWTNTKKNPTLRLSRMLKALQEANVTTLVDIRHSPCSSNLTPGSNYGPRDWNLQPVGAGIVYHLARVGIKYVWLVELGNPQKNDKDMTVLREHIDSGDENWPVNRGFNRLREIVEADVVCLLCACKHYQKCHRKVIAETFSDCFFGGQLEICDLSLPRKRAV